MDNCIHWKSDLTKYLKIWKVDFIVILINEKQLIMYLVII